MHNPFFSPIIALVLWTFVMWFWLYATRIPSISKLGIVYDPLRPNEEFMSQIPAATRWKADNYNNLMEQPPIFYAICLTLAFAGTSDSFTVGLAWLYVAIRVAHSLVHAVVNRIMARFGLFAAGSAVLLAMTVRAGFAIS